MKQDDLHGVTFARVLRELELLIAESDDMNEPRIPSERQLAESLGASRSTVREAIQRLVTRGLVTSRRGSGLFVLKAPAGRPRAAWLQLISQSAPPRCEMFEFRLIIEGSLARFAAERATDKEVEHLRMILKDMDHAIQEKNLEAEALADAEFHVALARASHNSIFDHLYRSVIPALRQHVAHNTFDASNCSALGETNSKLRLAQHEAIFEAIHAREPDAAFHAMCSHLQYIREQFS